MTKKDYELIAGALSRASTSVAPVCTEEFRNGAELGLKLATEFLVAALMVDNSAFDREKFMAAAGIADSWRVSK